jgi:hypothetical protein
MTTLDFLTCAQTSDIICADAGVKNLIREHILMMTDDRSHPRDR